MIGTLSVLLSSVADPSDFPVHSSASGLRQLDAAFRCTICSELFDGPVTLPCGHCFCSACIRTCLSDKQECPICRQPANESHLRTNLSLEEAVLSWRSAREHVLQLVRGEADHTCPRSSSPITPKNNSKASKKRKLDAKSQGRDENISSDDGIEYIAGPSTPRAHRATGPEKILTVSRGDSRGRDNIAPCPICKREILINLMGQHIDMGCPSSNSPSEIVKTIKEEETKAQWGRILGPMKGKGKGHERDQDMNNLGKCGPLPKVSYNILKDKQIKELLSENKLSSIGDRNTLIARHQRFVIMFNANLDRSLPQRQTADEIRQELRIFEENRVKHRSKKSVVGDAVAYQKANKAEFLHLVEAARPEPKKPPGSDDRHLTKLSF